jgi:hypothetical protein
MASASSLVQNAVADFILSLAPRSAGVKLLKSGLALDFDGNGQISVPGILSAASSSGFVVEGAPIPVRQLVVTAGASLVPNKLATISVFSREVFQQSKPNIRKLVGAVMAESTSLAFDAAMFDNAAATTARPAGLLNGISALTASAKTGTEAFIEDIQNAASAVAAVAGGGPIVFVMSPKQAVSALLRTTAFPFEILSSSALADKTIICCAANAIASAIDSAPRIEASDEATLVMQDSAPAQLGTVGTPPVVGAPARSLFATDEIGLRLVMEVSWSLRTAAGIAWIANVVW